MASRYSPDEVEVWLLNTEDRFETVHEFAQSNGLTTPVLYDARQPYNRYYANGEGGDTWAPYPLQVVVDREGVIRYISHQYDALAVQQTVDAIVAGD